MLPGFVQHPQQWYVGDAVLFVSSSHVSVDAAEPDLSDGLLDVFCVRRFMVRKPRIKLIDWYLSKVRRY